MLFCLQCAFCWSIRPSPFRVRCKFEHGHCRSLNVQNNSRMTHRRIKYELKLRQICGLPGFEGWCAESRIADRLWEAAGHSQDFHNCARYTGQPQPQQTEWSIRLVEYSIYNIYILSVYQDIFKHLQACVTDQEMLAEHEDIDNVQLFAQHFHGQFFCVSQSEIRTLVDLVVQKLKKGNKHVLKLADSGSPLENSAGINWCDGEELESTQQWPRQHIFVWSKTRYSTYLQNEVMLNGY